MNEHIALVRDEVQRQVLTELMRQQDARAGPHANLCAYHAALVALDGL